MTLKAIGENPILGTGPENLKEHFNRTNNEGFLAYKKRTGKTVDKAHSEILHIAAVSGIPAAIIFVLFLATLFWKKRRFIFNFNSSTILAMCITVYFIQSLFNISIITVAPLFWVLLGVFSREASISKDKFEFDYKTTNGPFLKDLKTCSWLITISSLIYLFYKLNNNPVNQNSAYIFGAFIGVSIIPMISWTAYFILKEIKSKKAY